MMLQEIYWTLPGPSRFTEQAVERLLGARNGVLGLSLPARRPDGVVDAIMERLREQGGGQVVRVQASDPVFERSIAHGLARAVGLPASSVSSVASLIDAPEMAAVTFVVDGVTKAAWPRWSTFLRGFAAEFTAVERVLGTTIAMFLPPDLPRSEVEFLFGRDEVIWRGVVTPTDTRLFVSKAMQISGSETLAERLAMEIVIRLAGWDLKLADRLRRCSIADLINPLPILRKWVVDPQPTSWSAGTVDEWDGDPFAHTLNCLAHGDESIVMRRVTSAGTTAIMPYVADVIEYYCAEHRDLLLGKLPYRFERGDVKISVVNLDQIEIGNLYYLLLDEIDEGEIAMLKIFLSMRNRVSHNRLPDAAHVMTVSDAWDRIKASSSKRGSWSWPRCGQTLTLVFGADDAHQSNAEVVSLDLVRADLWKKTKGEASEFQVCAEARRRIARIMARGESVMMNVTSLDRRHRLDIIDLVPRDMLVHYEVFELPPGWVPQTSRALAAANAPVKSTYVPYPEHDLLLAGDGRPHIKVLDRRAA